MAEQKTESHNLNVDREVPSENTQPNEQCAICQEPITKTNASFVDLCLHQYCFECLKKWCEVSDKQFHAFEIFCNFLIY